MNRRSATQAQRARSSEEFKREGQSLGCRVRSLRSERGWTLEEAGRRMSMDPKHLWKLERAYDGLNVTLVTLVRIAEAFEVPVQSLFAYRGEVRPVSRKKKSVRPRTRDTFTFQDAPQLEERYTRCVPLFELEDVAASIGRSVSSAQRHGSPLTRSSLIRSP